MTNRTVEAAEITKLVETRALFERRYLMVENGSNSPLATTDHLDVVVPQGCRLIDTLGEDGLGPGISETLGALHFRARATLSERSESE